MKSLLRYIIERFKPIAPVVQPVSGYSYPVQPGRKRRNNKCR